MRRLLRAVASAITVAWCGAAAGAPPELGSYEVTVNTRSIDGAVFAARDAAGRLYLDESTMRNWRVSLPGAERIEIDGLVMVRVDAVPGTRVDVDESKQTIALNFAPEHLAGTRFDVQPAASAPVALAPHWGGFFNYSLFGYTSGGESNGSGLFEAGIFGPRGTGLTSFGANTATTAGTTGELIRFDTSWRRDDPQSMRSLVMGDSISRPGFYGRPVRFGGIQYGKNFSLQPGFVSSPMLGFSGTAALPSTVDVYVGNQRIASQPVEPGPFTIDNVPAVSGSGTLQLIVRDAFGQQQVISQTFYGSPVLLAPGLNDYALSLGAQRRNYGIESADYNGAQAMALWRRGVTRSLTVEARAEADETVASAGIAGDFLLGGLGIGSLGLAASAGDAGSGSLWLAGIDRQAGRYSFGLRGTFASTDFRQVGDDGYFSTPKSNVTARAALNLGAFGSVGVALASQRYHEPARPAVDVGTVTWSSRVGKLASLSMSLSRVESVRNDTTLFATLSIPLGRHVTASAGTVDNLSDPSDPGRRSLSLNRSLPAYGEGYGYSVYADSDRRVEVGASLATRVARLRADLTEVRGTTAARASVEGGIGSVAGHTFLSRPIVDSFAVVSAGGIADLEVFQENQPAGTTDHGGLLLLTPLRAYVPNRLSIDPMTAPMGVAIGAETRQVTPTWRSGLLVDFDVKRGRSALVKLLAVDGSPLPTSALVRDNGSGQRLPVGLDGEVFVTGLPDAGTRLTVEFDGRLCQIAVLPDGDEPVLELGPYRCQPDD